MKFVSSNKPTYLDILIHRTVMIIFSAICSYYWKNVRLEFQIGQNIGVYAFIWISHQHKNIFCYGYMIELLHRNFTPQ